MWKNKSQAYYINHKLGDSICLSAICDIKQNNLNEINVLMENFFLIKP